MKFIIGRTSEFYSHDPDIKPCEGAYLEKISYYNQSFKETVEETVWVVDINSLEELLALSEKYGELIISSRLYEKPNFKAIEIYNDWRE